MFNNVVSRIATKMVVNANDNNNNKILKINKYALNVRQKNLSIYIAKIKEFVSLVLFINKIPD